MISWQQSREAKFNSINNKLKILLTVLSLIGIIIPFLLFGGGSIGLLFSLLSAACFNVFNSIVLLTYIIIRCHNPKLITRFWKKDKMFRGLETSIKRRKKNMKRFYNYMNF